MDSREIAYSRNGASTAMFCPTCGLATENLVACDRCFCKAPHDSDRPGEWTAAGIVAMRDWFYARGLSLRASGQMPPIAKACGECGARPCDCERPIWSYRYTERAAVAPIWGIEPAVSRGSAVWFRQALAHDDLDARLAIRRGPVQRITDPPYQFDAPANPKPRETATLAQKPPAHVEHRTLPAPSTCSLSWCAAPVPSGGTFCSTNCESAHEDRLEATTRRDAFVHRMTERGKNGQPQDVGLIGEVDWARAKTDEEIERIRRRWSALRHPPVEGAANEEE